MMKWFVLFPALLACVSALSIHCEPGKGYNWDSKSCETYSVVKAVVIPTCPPGTKYDNLSGNCVPDKPVVVCPPGFKSEYGTCVPLNIAPVPCPFGYSYIAGFCRPSSACPPGHVDVSGSCYPAYNG